METFGDHNRDPRNPQLKTTDLDSQHIAPFKHDKGELHIKRKLEGRSSVHYGLYSIGLYLCIYIAHIAVHTNQKRFQCKRP